MDFFDTLQTQAGQIEILALVDVPKLVKTCAPADMVAFPLIARDFEQIVPDTAIQSVLVLSADNRVVAKAARQQIPPFFTKDPIAHLRSGDGLFPRAAPDQGHVVQFTDRRQVQRSVVSDADFTARTVDHLDSGKAGLGQVERLFAIGVADRILALAAVKTVPDAFVSGDLKDVVALAPGQDVGIVSANDRIVAGLARQHILTVLARDPVIALRPEYGLIALRAADFAHIGQPRHLRQIQPTIARDDDVAMFAVDFLDTVKAGIGQIQIAPALRVAHDIIALFAEKCAVPAGVVFDFKHIIAVGAQNGDFPLCQNSQAHRSRRQSALPVRQSVGKAVFTKEIHLGCIQNRAAGLQNGVAILAGSHRNNGQNVPGIHIAVIVDQRQDDGVILAQRNQIVIGHRRVIDRQDRDLHLRGRGLGAVKDRQRETVIAIGVFERCIGIAVVGMYRDRAQPRCRPQPQNQRIAIHIPDGHGPRDRPVLGDIERIVCDLWRIVDRCHAHRHLRHHGVDPVGHGKRKLVLAKEVQAGRIGIGSAFQDRNGSKRRRAAFGQRIGQRIAVNIACGQLTLQRHILVRCHSARRGGRRILNRCDGDNRLSRALAGWGLHHKPKEIRAGLIRERRVDIAAVRVDRHGPLGWCAIGGKRKTRHLSVGAERLQGAANFAVFAHKRGFVEHARRTCASGPDIECDDTGVRGTTARNPIAKAVRPDEIGIGSVDKHAVRIDRDRPVAGPLGVDQFKGQRVAVRIAARQGVRDLTVFLA